MKLLLGFMRNMLTILHELIVHKKDRMYIDFSPETRLLMAKLQFCGIHFGRDGNFMRISGWKTGLTITVTALTALMVGGAKYAEGAQAVTLLNVSYDATREFYGSINDAFAADYLKKTGTQVTIQ